MMWFILSDLGSWGYTAGTARYYAVRGYDGITYYVVDTVLAVDMWDGSGSRCSFSPPIERAVFTTSRTVDPYTLDTGYAYSDSTYLVDFGGSEDWPALFGAYLRVLKFPLVVGDTWQAIDTCQFRPGERVPYVDEDWDGFVDSLYYDTSYATLVSVSGDTAEVHIYPAIFGKVFTGRTYSGDTMICCSREIYKYYLRFKHVYGVGMVFLSIDSLVLYSAFKMVDTTTWDTTDVPPALVGKFDNYQIWRYTTTSIREAFPRSKESIHLLKGGVMICDSHSEVFSVDGRLIVHLRKGESVRLKPGIYFVRMRRGIKKVVIR